MKHMDWQTKRVLTLCASWKNASKSYFKCVIVHEIFTTPKLYFLYAWVRASWIEFNNWPTRCNLFSFLHFCRQLYMFQVLTPIIRSSYNCNYSFWYWLTGSTTIRSRCWVGTYSSVSYGRYLSYNTEAVITVVRAPDHGCQHPKHLELPTEI